MFGLSSERALSLMDQHIRRFDSGRYVEPTEYEKTVDMSI